MFKRIYVAILMTVLTVNAYSQSVMSVEFDTIVKRGVPKGASSVNMCWLLDSDKHRPNSTQSMADALREVGVGSLRFPYGHLANNYLWHSGSYEDAKENGLRPTVAAKGTIPGNWDWAVNNDGTFIDAMDFDEYIDLCESQSIAPLVVVNCMSFKYDGGPTVAELAKSAADWVRYAQDKDYKVRYWQIGNEMDHHPKIITLDEFVDVYIEIASAMKAVDPSIQIGPGILGKANYFTAIYQKAPELVDFTSAHQYMWSFIESCKNYDMWSKSEHKYIKNITKMQAAVNKTNKKNMEILITESGVSPSNKGMGNISNVYKSLWWFEVLMSELRVKNVSYVYFWGSHSPWKGDKDDEKDDVALWFRMDDNSRKPTAEVSKFVNENLMENFVKVKNNNKSLRMFAMASSDKSSGSVFVMNKLKNPLTREITLNALPKSVKKVSVTSLWGEGPYARSLNYTKTTEVEVKDGKITVELPALSITNITY